MELIADLHLHSKYSRAVSPQMVIPEIAKWAKKKGIGLVGMPDWTHPLWLKEAQANLVEAGEGVFTWKDDPEGPRFLLVTEISSIFTQGGKGRRIHTLFFAPNFSVVEKINDKLRSRGVNLLSDGRPISGLAVRDLAEIVLSVSPECLVVPSHLWTPWFGTYGDKGGFNSLEEAYGDLAKNIFAIETGHSSDPAMNWRIKELDSRTILSFSDAHSAPKMSREATVFEVKDTKILGYKDIRQAIVGKWEVGSGKLDPTSHFQPHISYTIEFYPEEGKYHYTGHRNCKVKQSPEETKKLGETCPVCGRPLTVGVMHRVEELANRSKEEVEGEEWVMGNGVKGRKWGQRPPYVMLVPLMEILAEALGSGFATQTVLEKYNLLTQNLSSEFNVLLKASLEEIAKIAGEKVAEGVKKVREGNIVIDPGYDGVFGTVKIWSDSVSGEDKGAGGVVGEQTSLF